MPIQTNENIKISLENILMPSTTTAGIAYKFNTIFFKITIYDSFMNTTGVWLKYIAEINNLYDT